MLKSLCFPDQNANFLEQADIFEFLTADVSVEVEVGHASAESPDAFGAGVDADATFPAGCAHLTRPTYSNAVQVVLCVETLCTLE